MKISIISNSYNNINNYNSVSGCNSKPNYSVFSKSDKLSFGTTYTESEIRARQTLSKQRRGRIRELNENEYKNIMTEMIANHSDIDCRYKSQTDHFIDLSYCENIPFEFMGVIPYCGYESSSKRINRYLLGIEKQTNNDVEQRNADYISAMNYSIKKIDEKYGKFKGYTFRRGDFHPNMGRFYSTGASIPQNSYAYMHLDDGLSPSKIINYNIIKLKNGHRINSMLNEYAISGLKNLADQEDEILIDNNSKFRYIPEEKYSDDLKELRDDYYNKIVKLQKNNYTDEELKKKINIRIWEEI